MVNFNPTHYAYAVIGLGLVIFLVGSIYPPVVPWMTGTLRTATAVTGFVTMLGGIVLGRHFAGE